MSASFRAWSFPSGVSGPPGPGLSVEVGSVTVRHLEIDAVWVRALCSFLRESREALASYRVADLARILGTVGSRFADLRDPYRTEALALLPATSGLSREMTVAVLDGMAADWTPERLGAALRADFGNPDLLDGFAATRAGGSRFRAVGPGLCTQVVAGSVPGVGVTALIRSLLVKAPTLLKPGLGDVVLPVLFARALREEDATLADAAAVVYWPGGSEALENAALRQSEMVVAYGGDEAVTALRSRTPVTARFQAYHNRMSLGVVGRGALTRSGSPAAADAVAMAVGMFDQRGCVSPQVVYVEEGGEVAPPEFARHLAAALSELEGRLPSGRPSPSEAATLQQTRGVAEMMAATGSGVELHHGGEASWTVIYDPAPAFAAGCVARTVRVKPIADVDGVPQQIASFGRHLQTVGVTGCGARLTELAERLARVGVSRIAPFGRVAFPPAWWRHDGRGPLETLVRWVELDAKP